MTPDWLSRHKYQALLLAVGLFLIAYPSLRGPTGSPILFKALISVVFLAGGLVIFANRRLRLAAAILGTPAILGAWTGYALPDEHGPAVAVFFHGFALLFQLFVLVVLLRGVYWARTVSGDAVAAALCGYLVVGLAFSHAFCLVDAAVPGSFLGLASHAGEHQTHFQLTYFSFMTLTTVGFGDITPAGDTARSLALVEAVTGQFYLAVLVAELVGKRVAQALSPGPPA